MVEVTDSSSVSTTEKSSQKCEDFFRFYEICSFTTYKKKSTPAKTGRGDKRQMNNMDIADYPKK